MKIVWKKISEDDPIFKTWFIVSPIKKNPTKKQEIQMKLFSLMMKSMIVGIMPLMMKMPF